MAKFKTPPVIVLDFETFGIEPAPYYPPKPVSVSIKWPQDKHPLFYSWGHVTGGNNVAWHHAHKLILDVFESHLPILMHNSKFDIAVAETHCDAQRYSWKKYHDTLPLIFLDNPRAHTFQLKPAAETYFGQPPDERDVVRDWLMQNQPVEGVRITKSNFMKFIAYCPATIVEDYANGDVQRTFDLFQHVYPMIIERGMGEAYDRERRLIPILLNMEKTGVPVDWARLESDVAAYNICLQRLDAWLRKKIKAKSDVNLDSNEQLVEILVQSGFADPILLGVTKTGKLSATQDAYQRAIRNSQVRNILVYRSQLNNCLNTFMSPWLHTANQSGGLIYTSWNSVRTPSGQKSMGTRTGRLSSSPNFQNISNEFEPLFNKKGLPKAPIELLPMPIIRSYIIPFENYILLDRDFQQQELKVLAHYGDGVLLQAYKTDPNLDVHSYAQKLINELLHTNFARKPIKNVGFAISYGAGLGKIAMMLGSTVEEARTIKNAYLRVFPELKMLYDDMRRRAKADEPIRTFGGRQYWCEDPEIINGQIRTYDYRMTNILVQGSSADITKESMIQFHEYASPDWFMYLSVHDELLIAAPYGQEHEAMECLRQAMDNTPLDIPLLSDGKYSFENWAALQPYNSNI